MYSATTVRQFDPHDPRYYQCCCAARIHVASMAKAIAGICIISNFLSIWPAIVEGTSWTTIAGSLFGSGVMAVAAFQEHRPTLIFLLVLQGLGISIIGLAVFLIIVALVIGSATNKFFNEHGPLMVTIAIYQVILMLWSFMVNLHFYAYLSDRDRAGAMAYQYRNEHQVQYQQQQQQSSSRGPPRAYREQPQKPKRIVNEDHISYPIYNVRRTPSITPAHSPSLVPSAPIAPAVPNVKHDEPPPSYESLEEKSSCVKTVDETE